MSGRDGVEAMKEYPRFQLGDTVEWRGHRGVITEVVPAGEAPKTYTASASPRKHESYVVSVVKYHKKWGTPLDTKTYWPRVKWLRKVEE